MSHVCKMFELRWCVRLVSVGFGSSPSCLRSISVYRDRLLGECLNDEVTHDATIILQHARTIGIWTNRREDKTRGGVRVDQHNPTRKSGVA